MKQINSAAAKPKTGMARLMELAATKKPLMVSSVILSALPLSPRLYLISPFTLW